MLIRLLFAAAGFVAVTSLAAQPPKADIPPEVIPSTFRMFLVTDERFEPLKDAEGNLLKGIDGKPVPSPKNRQGKIHCLVCEYGLNPTVVAFVRADAKSLDGATGVAKLAKGLNAMIPKYRADKLSGFVSFLRLKGGTKPITVKVKRADGTEADEKIEVDLEYADDEKRGEHKEAVENLAKALAVPHVPFGLAPETSKAVTAWGVKDTDEVTVVVYHRMRRVGAPWTFAKTSDLTDEKVAEILKSVETAITERERK